MENYVPIIEAISSKIEGLENEILSRSDTRTLRKIHRIRQDILFMRRTVFRSLRRSDGSKLRGQGFSVKVHGLFLTSSTTMFVRFWKS